MKDPPTTVGAPCKDWELFLVTQQRLARKRQELAMLPEDITEEAVVPLTSSQSCRRLPKFGRSPDFGSFQKIEQKIAQNFCAILKLTLRPSSQSWNWVKTSNGVGEN